MVSEAKLSGLRLRPIKVKENNGTTHSTQQQEEIYEPVTPAGRLFMQPDLNCHIMCTLGFKNPINVAEFKKGLMESLVNHKRFHSVMRKDKNGTDIWVPVEVDMDYHVFEPTGYSASQMATPHFCEEYISELAASSPFDMSRPMWACHVLNGASGDTAAHMIIRVHHSLGDGTSLMSLLLACTRQIDKPDQLPSVPEVKKRRNKASLLMRLLTIISLVRNTLVGVFLFLSTLVWLKDSDTFINSHDGVDKMKETLVYAIVDVNDMRTVKDAVNGTINDVLMGMVGAGLKRYLEGHYKEKTFAGKHDSKLRNGKLEDVSTLSTSSVASTNVEHLQVRAVALMNTRGTPGLQELASMMQGGSQTRWGNHLGYLLFPVSLKYHKDSLEYVQEAKRVSDRMKASLEGTFTYWSGALLMRLFGPALAAKVTRRVILHTTLSVSNVPGPMEPIMFCGNPIVKIFSTVSGHPQSLCVFLQSYRAKASLVLMAAKEIISDPEVLCQHFVDTLQDMKESALLSKLESL